MLPPGHAAAGFLLAYGITHITTTPLTPAETNIALSLGAFAGFAPDIDMFWAFARAKSFSFAKGKVNHRNSFIHTPLFWLIAGSAVWLSGSDSFTKLLALTITAGGLSHLVLDSFKMGIRWFYPLSKNYFGFMYAGEKHHYNRPQPTFFSYWFTFLKTYITEPLFRPTFILEVVIVSSACLVLMLI